MGEAPARTSVVQSTRDVDRLGLSEGVNIAYVTRTTLSPTDTDQIVRRLRARFLKIVGPRKANTRCATQSRQQAIRALASEADVVLVVSSDNSNNGRRLTEIAEEKGISRSHRVVASAGFVVATHSSCHRSVLQNVLHFLLTISLCNT